MNVRSNWRDIQRHRKHWTQWFIGFDLLCLTPYFSYIMAIIFSGGRRDHGQETGNLSLSVTSRVRPFVKIYKAGANPCLFGDRLVWVDRYSNYLTHWATQALACNWLYICYFDGGLFCPSFNFSLFYCSALFVIVLCLVYRWVKIRYVDIRNSPYRIHYWTLMMSASVYSNAMGVNSGAGTAHPSGASEIISSV